MASQKPDNRHVNHLLHTLRGEQFRHSQNVRKSKTHISSTFLRNKPTLPIDLTSSDFHTVFQVKSEESSGTRNTRALESSPSSSSNSANQCSGPAAPKSWTLTALKQDRYETAAWRSEALSLLLSQLEGSDISLGVSRPPPLTMLCLEHLIARSTMTELREDILPYIPPHHRASWVRYTAIHSPLPNQRLFALYEEEGHADGEIFVVGPNNSLRDDYFLQTSIMKERKEAEAAKPASWDVVEEEWDSDAPLPVLLQTLAILSCRLSSTTVLSFPPTITHLALIHLPIPIALHRLPQLCTLLVFLDLSYNDWLAAPSKETNDSWKRIDWGRWSQLKTLGLRETDIPREQLQKINQSRWEDIEIIL